MVKMDERLKEEIMEDFSIPQTQEHIAVWDTLQLPILFNRQ